MVLVFKTNINSRQKIKELSPVLNDMDTISKWNVDLQDCDNVLRIESPGNISVAIKNTLEANGFACEELE